MNLQEISELTVQRVFSELLYRIINTSGVPAGSPVFQLDLDENKSFYDRVIVHQSLVKPSLQAFEEELEELKSELAAKENARLAEIARVEDIRNRFAAIADLRGAISQAELSIPNPSIELERIVKENDTQRLELLEAKGAEFVSTEIPKIQRKAAASQILRIINGCVKIVIENNLANNLSKEQKDQQKTDYPDLFVHLQDYRPAKFKSSVEAINPDGTIVTQELKDELLGFLASNGIA